PRRLLAELREDAGKREVHAFEGSQLADLERSGRIAQGVDELVRALVALPPLAQAAVHDFLEVVAAGQPADLPCREADARVALDEHAEELADLVDVVARLPLGDGPGQDLAGRGQRVVR